MNPGERLIRRWTNANSEDLVEHIAEEEPLEIVVAHSFKESRRTKSLGWTLRTPGQERELAVGLLFSEGWVNSREEVVGFEYAGDRAIVELHPDVDLPETGGRRLTRTGACGFCGRADLLRRELHGVHADATRLPLETVYKMPELLRQSQSSFQSTGGVHAAAILTAAGACLSLFEDVGRHNAVDKLIGDRLLHGALPSHGQVLLLSGRAGFELLQKAAAAEFPIVVALGAPTTLAVSLAQEQGITLVGFTRANRCNVYSHAWRIGG